jgi:hypothetical protein
LSLKRATWAVIRAKQVGHGHLKHTGDLGKAASTYAVLACLIFLDLLEGHAERIREFRLRHPDRLPLDTDALSYLHVDLIWTLRTFHGFALAQLLCWAEPVQVSSSARRQLQYFVLALRIKPNGHDLRSIPDGRASGPALGRKRGVN